MPRKKIVRIFILGLFMLFQVYLFFFKQYKVLDYSPTGNEIPFQLGSEKTVVCQEFRAPGPLARIDIMLANYLTKPQGGTLRLSIFNNNTNRNNLLYLKNYPANQTEDNRFYSFSMEREKKTWIPKGQYYLQLDYFPHDPLERLAVWITKRNLYPHGSLLINHQRQTGDMTFRVYYFSSLWNVKAKWLNNIPGQPFLPFLLAFCLLLLLLILNGLFFYITGFLFAAGRPLREKHGG